MTDVLTLLPNALAEYQEWLSTIKQRIVSVRIRMALAASRELIGVVRPNRRNLSKQAAQPKVD